MNETKHFAVYVHKNRRGKSGKFDADMDAIDHAGGRWELAAVFSATGAAIRFQPKKSDYELGHVLVDGESRTARKLMANDTAGGRFARLWTKPPNPRTAKPYRDIGHCAVYEDRKSGVFIFERVAGGGRALWERYEVAAIVEARGREDLYFRFHRPNAEPGQIEADGNVWNAGQILGGEALASGLVALAWKRDRGDP